MKMIEEKWNQIAPNHPYEYFFLDEFYDSLYRSDERLGRIFQAFTLFAIFIGCLGLIGLASFAAEQRTKEIGIRKVCGASIPNLYMLLSKEFVKWVVVANIIAWPITYFMMHKWLQNFIYRIDITLWTFLFGGLLTLIIALILVSYQAVKTSAANPIDALKYE